MSEKKSLVEEALLSMQNLEEAIAENAKGILASTMKQEISELVKESLKEQETEDADMDAEDDDMDAEDADMDAEDADMDAEDADMDAEDADMDAEESDDEMDMDMDSSVDTEEPIDLRNFSPDDVLKVFKSMKDDDGIIVTKDEDEIHLEDNNEDVEYIIDLGESVEDEMEESKETEMDESWEEEMDESSVDGIMEKMFQGDDEDEAVYEIHMDEEDDEEEFEFDSEESDDDEEEFEFDSEESDDDESDDEELEFDDEDSESDDDDEDFESDDEDDSEFDEEDLEEDSYSMNESFKKIKPKGVGMGKVKKSVFTQPAKKVEAKEGSIMTKPKVGKGAAKVGGKNTEVFTQKPVGKKSETKEGWGSKKHEFKRKKVDGVEKKAGTKDGHFKDYEKAETKEAARTLGNGKRWGKPGLDKPKAAPRHLALETELKALREKNEEYRKALNIFREKLNEVAVFNSNLAYATRLFTEHSTTKQEKLNILRRFDGVESIKESKTLYKSIKDELSSSEKPVVKESIERKIEKVQSTGSSINLIESKTYENPQFMRMKDLMSKIK